MVQHNIELEGSHLRVNITRMQEAIAKYGPVLTRQEAANLLSLSIRFLDYRIKDGTIPVVRLGKRVFIRNCDLVAYVNSWESTW